MYSRGQSQKSVFTLFLFLVNIMQDFLVPA